MAMQDTGVKSVESPGASPGGPRSPGSDMVECHRCPPGVSVDLSSYIQLRITLSNVIHKLTCMSKDVSSWNLEVLERFTRSDSELLALKATLDHLIHTIYAELESERQAGVQQAEQEFLHIQQNISACKHKCEELFTDLESLLLRQQEADDGSSVADRYTAIKSETEQLLENLPSVEKQDIDATRVTSTVSLPHILDRAAHLLRALQLPLPPTWPPTATRASSTVKCQCERTRHAYQSGGAQSDTRLKTIEEISKPSPQSGVVKKELLPTEVCTQRQDSSTSTHSLQSRSRSSSECSEDVRKTPKKMCREESFTSSSTDSLQSSGQSVRRCSTDSVDVLTPLLPAKFYRQVSSRSDVATSGEIKLVGYRLRCDSDPPAGQRLTKRRNSQPVTVQERSLLEARQRRPLVRPPPQSQKTSEMSVRHQWTYQCDLYESGSKVTFSDVKQLPNGEVCAVDTKLCQLLWFDGHTGMKKRVHSYKHGNPMACRIDMKPFSMAIDANDNIFITDKRRSCVQLFQNHSNNFQYRTPLGKNLFQKPRGIAMSSLGQLAVVDKSYGKLVIIDPETNSLVQKFEMAKIVAEKVKTPSYPALQYVAYDSLHKRLLVSDHSMHCIHVMDPASNQYLCSYHGQSAECRGGLSEPYGICVNPTNGQILVADYICDSTMEYDTGRLVVLDDGGRYLKSFLSSDFHPRAVDLNLSSDIPEVLVACTFNSKVSKYTLVDSNNTVTHL